MTLSHLHLQRTSLCCAKMRMSVLDDGGEVMAIAIGCIEAPRRLLGAKLAPLVQEKRRPRPCVYSEVAGAMKEGTEHTYGEEMLNSGPRAGSTLKIASFYKKLMRKRAPRRLRRHPGKEPRREAATKASKLGGHCV